MQTVTLAREGMELLNILILGYQEDSPAPREVKVEGLPTRG